jgi:hypothetical protein
MGAPHPRFLSNRPFVNNCGNINAAIDVRESFGRCAQLLDYNFARQFLFINFEQY